MSLTPIEDQDRAGAAGPDRGDSSGVRQRLRTWVSRVTSRVVGAVASAFSRSASRERQADADTETAATSIAPGWSGKLEEDRSRESPELPAGRRGAHTRDSDGSVTATVEEDRLRIEHDDHSEEYISSDVYERIER